MKTQSSKRSRTSPPTVVVIGGPNGAGKTTYAEGLLQAMGISEFVNADRIAQGLSGPNASTVAMEAGRIMLNRLRTLSEAGVSFGFESTLFSRSFAPFLQRLRDARYRTAVLRHAAIGRGVVSARLAPCEDRWTPYSSGCRSTAIWTQCCQLVPALHAASQQLGGPRESY